MQSACSGKCKGNCTRTPRMWVIAACDGMISVFEKSQDGHLHCQPQGDNSVFPSLEEFRWAVTRAAQGRKFDKLVVVGTASDIAWLRLSLPDEVANAVVAEIEYPLVSGWFRQPGDMKGLTQALEHLFQA